MSWSHYRILMYIINDKRREWGKKNVRKHINSNS
ncbi:MAG: hypothetical protein IKI94_02495 [Ruminococcus sp.]|nr:hypothetical protein [Ruminococcus sp.]